MSDLNIQSVPSPETSWQINSGKREFMSSCISILKVSIFLRAETIGQLPDWQEINPEVFWYVCSRLRLQQIDIPTLTK